MTSLPIPDVKPTLADALLKKLPDPEEQPTMTVDEGAGYYGLSRGAMFAAVKRGAIPSFRVGRRILLPTAAVRRQLQIDADG